MMGVAQLVFLKKGTHVLDSSLLFALLCVILQTFGILHLSNAKLVDQKYPTVLLVHYTVFALYVILT